MTPAKAALVVGIDTYPTNPLDVCVHDAVEVAAILSMPEYGFDVSKVFNADASRRNLKMKIDALFRSSADSYLLYFSGHGWATDVGVYLVTHDADEVEHGVDLEWLKRLINNLTPPNATVAIILDCCHAGAATARALGHSGVNMRRDDLSAAIPSFPAGRVVLAACRGDQVAYEDSKLGHGVFHRKLDRWLNGRSCRRRWSCDRNKLVRLRIRRGLASRNADACLPGRFCGKVCPRQ